MPWDWEGHLSRAQWVAPARATRADQTPTPCGDTLPARIGRTRTHRTTTGAAVFANEANRMVPAGLMKQVVQVKSAKLIAS